MTSSCGWLSRTEVKLRRLCAPNRCPCRTRKGTPKGESERIIRKDFKLVKNQGNSLNQGNFPYPCFPLITLVGGRETARTAIGSERKRKTAKDRGLDREKSADQGRLVILGSGGIVILGSRGTCHPRARTS